jgi:predicted dehydrogenase
MSQVAGRLRIAVVGLRFGGSFPPIYLEHPDVAEVTICDSDAQTLQAYGDKYGIARRTTNVEDLLASREIDAIHLVTPIPSHASLSTAVLESGKHCACTVPMATTLDELWAIVAAQKRSGLNYMMMETAAYTYHCLFVEELIARGEIGRIQFLRGAHYQDMENWPAYWMGLPPMHYATHAVAPLLKLAQTRATRVHCFGSGVMRPELHAPYGNPYPVETAIFQLDREGLAAEVTRTLFHTAVQYAEIFSVYGEKATFNWVFEDGLPVVYRMAPLEAGRGRPITTEQVTPPSYQDRLPESIRLFDGHQVIPDPQNPHQSIIQGGGHHGSHPHLVHEFVRSIVERRKPAVDAVTGANWTAAGICAHESAMRGGAAVEIPAFGENRS